MPTWSHTARTSGRTGMASRSIRIPTPDAAATSSNPPITPPSVASCIDVTPRVAQPECGRHPRLGHHRHLLEQRVGASHGLAPPRPPPGARGNVAANSAVVSIAAPFVTTTRSPGRAIVGA